MAREFWRKIVHLSAGLALILLAVYLENTYSLTLVRQLLFALLLFSITADFLMADVGVRIPIYSRVQRKKELTGFHSSTYLVLGALISLQFFPFDIALAAISMLVFGDAMAALVGQKWGVPFYRKKSILGTVAMFVTSTAAGLFFVPSFLVVIAMALVAALIEFFSQHIDDNLMIPIFAGLVGLILSLV